VGTQTQISPILGKAKRERYKSSIYNFYKYKGILFAYLLKSYFILVQLISSIIFLLKFNFLAGFDRLKFVVELFKYSVNESGMGVVGYYGSGNKGDEIILHSLIESQQGKFKNIFVLTNNISETSQLHEVKARNKKSLFDNLYVLFSTNELIIGGGGFIFKKQYNYIYLYANTSNII